MANSPPPPLSIYAHTPFCKERCPYCDFFVLVERDGGASERGRRYLELIYRELDLALERSAEMPGGELKGRDVATIYLGGGTPSLFTPDELAPLFELIRTSFNVPPDAEITMEANPSSLLVKRLPGYLALGINRFSLGVQTFDEAGLRTLGRGHSADQARAALAAVRDMSEDPANPLRSFTADLIFGYPGQTLAGLEDNLRELIEDFRVPHISAYALALHDGTPMQKRVVEGRMILPDDDETVAMFYRLREIGREAGLPPYEISNLARPGHESRHNTAYWRLGEMLPLGPSACGYLGGRRVANPRGWEEWATPLDGESPAMVTTIDKDARASSPALAWEWEESLTGRARAGEVVMCALRRTEGAAWDWLAEKAGADLREFYATEIDEGAKRGWLDVAPDRLAFTEEGVRWSDEFFTMLY